ncbi:hypothetical protein GQ457_13G016950 [Hibiscus cannabinus]
MIDETDVNEDDVVYVLRYFHGGKIPVVTFNTAALVLVHDDDTVRKVIEILKKKGSVDLYVACLEEVDTVNGGNAVVGSNAAGSSYDHEDHIVGQKHVEVEGGGPDTKNVPQHVEVGPEGKDSIDGNGLEDVDVGPDAENGLEIVDNESSDDNGSKHVEVGPEITDIWADHVDVDVGAGVDDVNGNGANHVDVDDNGNRADHVDVGPDYENGSQHAENGPDSDTGLDHVDIGPEVDDVEPEFGDDRPELADDDTTNDNGAEDGLDGSEEDAFLFNIDIVNDVDEEVEDIRENGRGKRYKEKAADREQATYREDQPVQPDNADDGYRSSDKDGKLEGYETDYISSSDPGEYEDSEQSDDDAPRVRQSLLPRFDDNKQFKEAVRKYAFAKRVQLKIVKNEPNRTRFHCMKGCPWTLFASTDKKLRCYTVKTYSHVHKSYRTNKNKLISTKYIQKQFKGIILANPKMKVKTLKEICKRELGESFNMCQRARKQLLSKVGKMVVDQAKKRELLVTAGRDANNQMFPIAWAVVEHPTGEGITLMSNQQKGLVKVLVEDYPDTEYRTCARHLSTYIEEFDHNLQKLEKLGPTSTEDLLQIPIQHWANAYFFARPTCDVVDNNMVEAFNALILDARCKPIINLLEDIRIIVISRLVWNGDEGFEVQHGEDQHIVDMKQLKCTCRA